MKNHIKKLPNEIISKIISYSYCCQPKELQKDIQNYHEMKIKIFQLYRSVKEEDTIENKQNILSDLVTYCNKYNSIAYGYIDDFYSFFYRMSVSKQFHTKDQINSFLEKMEKKPFDTQFNLFWGLLTPEERNEFVSHRYIIDALCYDV